MPLPVIEFDEEELDRFYSEGASGGPVFETAVVGNPISIQQRNINRQDAIREYDISFEGMEETDRTALEAFFITKYGGGIGFKFMPPTDNRFLNEIIGHATGANGDVVYLKRGYSNPYRTIVRRILKPVKG